VSVFRRGRLGERFDLDAAAYTSSLDFDREILRATIWVNAVHLKLLCEKGALGSEELEKALKALRRLEENPPEKIDPRLEDVHGLIEKVASEASEKAGGMLAYGKSRNDAVAAAIRIRARERLLQLTLQQLQLIEALLKKALEHVETIFPAYTHLQRAAPATFGFILHGHAQRLLRNAENAETLLNRINLSPMGAAAVVGTSAPIDRLREAELLGFDGVLENALDATTSRDFLLMMLAHLFDSATSLSNLAEEMVVYSSSEFGLIELPDEFSSTSSVMPQKKNPVVAEIARTKSAEVLGELVKAAVILTRLPGGYSLDLQQVTPKLWNAVDELERSFKVMAKMVPSLRVRAEEARKACLPPVGMAEAANLLVKNFGLNFRKAHQLCALIARLMLENELDEPSFQKTLSGFGLGNKLTLREFLEWMEPERIVASYSTLGSSNPREVERMVNRDLKRVGELRMRCSERLTKFEELYCSALNL